MAARGPKRVASQVFCCFLLQKGFFQLLKVHKSEDRWGIDMSYDFFTFVTINQQTAGLEKKTIFHDLLI